MQQHKLVKVTWIDAADPEDGGWHTDEAMEKFSKETVEVTSVGFMKSDTKLYLTICADRIPEEDGCTWGRPTKIPHGMIVKIEELTALQSPQESHS